VEGRRRRRLRAWAEELVADHGSAVAALIGVEPPLPRVTIEIEPGGEIPGVTSGTTIVLGERWFEMHPDDVGCVLHELTHAYMWAPDSDEDTLWLIEGIADLVRDELGYDAPWTSAHHEPGKARAGYQTTAHFLRWLDDRAPGAVAELSRRLSAGTYTEGAFGDLAERPLDDLIELYETGQAARP
jgi:basic secretory peptidase family protein